MRAYSTSLVILLLAAILAGCGGGGGTGQQAGVNLTIGADTLLQQARGRATALGAPLDPGATVTVYNFRNGNVIATGKTGANGFCTLEVPSGLTVAVVIEGKRGGKDFRLSTIIPVVPVGGGEYIADPATSIAAEAIAAMHYRKDKALDELTFESVLAKASEYVEAHQDADFSLSGGLIKGETFGGAGSIDATELAEVIAAVPVEIDNELVMGKNAVAQIKAAGMPLELMLGQELPDLENIFTEQVQDAYQALAVRLNKLIVPAMLGDMEYNGSNVSINDLDVGKAYKVTQNFDGYLVIEDDINGIAGQVTIRYTDPAGTYTVVRKIESGNIVIRQTFQGDSEQEYEVRVPEGVKNPGADPRFTASISLKDSVFTTPLTFSGTVTADGADMNSYSRVVFDGSLNTPELKTTGRYQADFRTTIPSGAHEGATIYEFPTSFTMSNASVTITGGGTTIKITGSISATFVVNNSSGYAETVPNHVAISGTYSNSHSGLGFSGSITGDWTNASTANPDNPTGLIGSIRLKGDLTREGHPTYHADLTFNLNSGTLNAKVDLGVGPSKLSGAGSGTLDPDKGLVNATLTLTNQDGVAFTLNTNAQGDVSGGAVTVGGESVASITLEGDLLKIKYTDNTFDAFMI